MYSSPRLHRENKQACTYHIPTYCLKELVIEECKNKRNKIFRHIIIIIIIIIVHHLDQHTRHLRAALTLLSDVCSPRMCGTLHLCCAFK
jgi:hypothetical protein